MNLTVKSKGGRSSEGRCRQWWQRWRSKWLGWGSWWVLAFLSFKLPLCLHVFIFLCSSNNIETFLLYFCLLPYYLHNGNSISLLAFHTSYWIFLFPYIMIIYIFFLSFHPPIFFLNLTRWMNKFFPQLGMSFYYFPGLSAQLSGQYEYQYYLPCCSGSDAQYCHLIITIRNTLTARPGIVYCPYCL